jgi:hypothetical protein
MAYSESGLRALVEEHMSQHFREDREQIQQTTALALFRPPQDYNVLKLTAHDMGFLKTRGIQVDESDWDLSADEKPSKTKLSQSLWASILEKAWRS